MEALKEKEEQQNAAYALEEKLLQTTQQELDAIDREHVSMITGLLMATAAQVICASAALEAKHRADVISDRLTIALDDVHRERLQLQKLTDDVNTRSAELNILVSSANIDHIKSKAHLRTAQTQVSRFSLATQATGLVQEQIEASAIEDHISHNVTVYKERDEARARSRHGLEVSNDSQPASEMLHTNGNEYQEGSTSVERSHVITEVDEGHIKRDKRRSLRVAEALKNKRVVEKELGEYSRTSSRKLLATGIPQAKSIGTMLRLQVSTSDMTIPAESNPRISTTNLSTSQLHQSKTTDKERSGANMSRPHRVPQIYSFNKNLDTSDSSQMKNLKEIPYNLRVDTKSEINGSRSSMNACLMSRATNMTRVERVHDKENIQASIPTTRIDVKPARPIRHRDRNPSVFKFKKACTQEEIIG
ncbi:hypothetical protein K439DRAFT_1634140, partial [Ramaria rubella]